MSTFSDRLPGNEMSPQQPRGFWGNVGLIRPAAWVIALIVFGVIQALFWFVIWPHSHPDELEKLSDFGKICIPLATSIFFFAYVLLVGFVYVDAKRRGMRYVMWTLLGLSSMASDGNTCCGSADKSGFT